MYDYGRLVFLDNQKTGSTFVSVFLQTCCTLPHVKSKKHHPVLGDYRPDSVYFSTVRDPVDLYVSLFRYGQDKRGGTYKRLKKLGRLDLYENMTDWLGYVLDERNAAVFQESYGRFAPLGLGLMSFRAMHITLRNPVKLMAAAQSYDHLIGIWNRRNIAGHIFRQEDLNADLYRFATETVPEFFDQDAVRSFLDTPERVNASVSKADAAIPAPLMRQIRLKERFLIDRFYPARMSIDRKILTLARRRLRVVKRLVTRTGTARAQPVRTP